MANGKTVLKDIKESKDLKKIGPPSFTKDADVEAAGQGQGKGKGQGQGQGKEQDFQEV